MAITTAVGLAGLAIGLAFGAITRWADFCALGALADLGMYGDYRRLRSWLLAIATAMLGAHVLHWTGIIDIYGSIYLGPVIGWFGAIIDGLMFGYGTVMARGCGGRSLIRLAGGDLRALVTLLTLGIFAHMTLRGLTGAARVWIEGVTDLEVTRIGTQSQGLPDLLGAAFGLTSDVVRSGFVVVLVSGLAFYCLRDKNFRSSAKHMVAGLGIGVLVTLGWAATGVLGADEFEPVAFVSLSYVRPIGDSLQYLMTFTGATVTFGVAVVGGTLLGGLGVAVSSRTFRIDGFNAASEMSDYLVGGALMGIGGVLALGCTIGQGVTGIATLSLGSLLSVAAIVTGGWLAISRLGLDTADEALGPAAGE